jgi:hypothetical protein
VELCGGKRLSEMIRRTATHKLIQRASSGLKRKCIEGFAPLWGSEFTTKAAIIQEGESKELILGPFVMFFNPVFPACMVHEFLRS